MIVFSGDWKLCKERRLNCNDGGFWRRVLVIFAWRRNSNNGREGKKKGKEGKRKQADGKSLWLQLLLMSNEPKKTEGLVFWYVLIACLLQLLDSLLFDYNSHSHGLGALEGSDEVFCLFLFQKGYMAIYYKHPDGAVEAYDIPAFKRTPKRLVNCKDMIDVVLIVKELCGCLDHDIKVISNVY